MNGNVAIVAVVLVAVGAAVASGSLGSPEPAPLVDDLEAYDGLPGECHLGASINPARLDDGERLIFEQTVGNESRTDTFRATEERTAWGVDVARGANLTVYTATLDDEGGSIDVRRRSFVTADCRLVGRAAP